MDLLATLRRSGGIDAVARQVGLPPTTASPPVEALLPVLLHGLGAYARRMGGDKAGVAATLAMIDEYGDGYLAAEVMGPGPLNADSGERIIAQIFGSTDAKRKLAEDAAVAADQDAALLQRIAAPLVMLVCGYIAARAKADDSDGEGLGWIGDLLALPDDDEPRAGSASAG